MKHAERVRSPFELSPREWKSVVLRTLSTMASPDTSLRAAGVAFFSFLSIFPAIAIVVFLVGIFLISLYFIRKLQRAA